MTRHLQEHPLLRKKLRQKIAKFERHLVHYPLDALHLQITLERHPTKLVHTASLSLRVPSQVLHSGKSHRDVINAFDEAVRALLRELIAFKRHLRREEAWKRRERGGELHVGKITPFADEPQPDGSGPQSLRDVVRALVEKHYRQLLRYARRQLWHDVSAGELSRDAIDPRAVVDAVVGRALLIPERRPERLTFVLWLYTLVRDELERRRRVWREQEDQIVSLEGGQLAPVQEGADSYDAEQSLDSTEREPESAPVAAVDLADENENPAEATTRRDLLAEVRKIASRWPQSDREIFELHFVERFDAGEIALITRQVPAKMEKQIEILQTRLRDEVRGQALI